MIGKPSVSKAMLRRVGSAALSGWSDARLAADPAAAVEVAQTAMRAALQANLSADARRDQSRERDD